VDEPPEEAPEVTDEFLAWQKRTSAEGRPFMAFLNYYDAHLPYDPPAPWRTKFGADPGELELYDGAIAFIDDALGRLFTELAARGVLDSTMVIVTSDHGEGFGEHGLHGHGNSLYLTELHVPLVIRYPARIAGNTRVAAPVTLRDLAATALDGAGVAAEGRATGIAGESWLAQLGAEGSRNGSDVISEVSEGINTEPSHPVSRGPMRSLVSDSTHYIRNGDGVEELYHWRQDPVEARDAAPSSAAQVTRLRDLLAAVLR
jgi:arylsulfatase A-like enzyme